MQALAGVRRTASLEADSVLDRGRFSSAVSRDDAWPFGEANVKGQPRSAFPTLVTYHGSRAFRLGCPGAVYDQVAGAWDEPNVEERERILGYVTGATAAATLSEHDRRVITGNCMDQRALAGLIRTCLSVAVPAYAQHRASVPVAVAVLPSRPTPPHRVPNPAGHMSISVFSAHLSERGYTGLVPEFVVGPVVQAEEDSPEPVAGGGKSSSATFRGNRRMAAGANEPSQCDIHLDTSVLGFMAYGSIPEGLTHPQIRRIIRRAKGYKVVLHPAGDMEVHRQLHNGTYREVPPPGDRVSLIQRAHHLSGHFGIRRTAHLLLLSYWWQGIMKDVAGVVGQCKVCDRVRASFNAPSPVMNPVPINGLFYSWGVDTSGPFPTSRRGNKYIMHAIEHFSKTLILEPLPSKEAKDTAYAFTHGVLARFGASAQVITDGGTEYQGEFHQVLTECFIDHRTTSPNHPQANGLAERSVQTVKRALKCHCEDVLRVDDWDEKLPFVSLAYNCSRQMSTKCSPYMLLYAREPKFPSPVIDTHMHLPIPAVDSLSPATMQEAAATILDRAHYLEQAMPVVANNLAISQHRDTLRYAKTRSGHFSPRLRKFAPGDFVYMRRPNQLNTLQVAAKQVILRVVEVRSSGTVVLQGRCAKIVVNHRQNLAPCHLPYLDGTLHPGLADESPDTPCTSCGGTGEAARMLLCDVCDEGWHMHCLKPVLTAVPKGQWVCPSCRSAGVVEAPESKPKGPIIIPTREQLAEKLFTNPTTRARDHAAQLLDGFLVQKVVKGGRRGKGAVISGVGHFQGLVHRPYYFLVKYADGTEEVLTDTAFKARKPQPPTSVLH